MELLVVIAIIGVLVALLLPAIQAAREAARRTDCQNRLRQVAIALQNHHDAKLRFPQGSSMDKATNTTYTALSWIAFVLPYMEQQSMQKLVDVKQSWNAANNFSLPTATTSPFRTPVEFLNCPSQEALQLCFITPPGSTNPPDEVRNLQSHYIGIMGAKATDISGATGCPNTFTTSPQSTWTMADTTFPGATGSPCNNGGIATNGILYIGSKTNLKEVTDGSSNTFIVGEASWDIGPQRPWLVGNSSHTQTAGHFTYVIKNMMHPFNTAYRVHPQPAGGFPFHNNDASMGSLHPGGGAHFAMCDASVRWVSESVDLETVLKPMSTRASDEIVQSPL